MNCGCRKKTCKICCGNVSQATPLQPFCGPANSCPEDHCQEIITQQFVAALKIVNSWNVPACGGSATLYVQGLVAVSIGSYLWNSQYGYFEIVGFDKDTSQLTVQNNCFDGNAPEGTQVPACTYFIVSDAPLEAGGSGSPGIFPFVAIDFTAPLDEDCLLITTTNVNGLVVGKNVQIGSGTYRVESIPDATHIVICNDGLGITPGTAVIAKNAANQYQYPIILIDANPCTNDPVDSGCLTVCKDNIMYPLGGLLKAGAVPTLIADDSCDVEFKLLEVPTKTCTTITCCLTLVTGQAAYIISVADSSQFVVGDVLQIGTRTDRFTITAIPDATHIQGTLDPVPGAITDIEPGTSICIVDCCELLEILIESEDFRCSDFQNRVFMETDGVQSVNADIVLDSGNTSADSSTGSIVVDNESECRDMSIFLIQEVYVFGNSLNANANLLNLDLRVCLAEGGVPAEVLGGAFHLFPKSDAEHQYTFTRSLSGFHAVALTPAATMTFNHLARAVWTGAGAAAFTIDPLSLSSRLTIVGVAI